ncbi:MAG: tetratricopeptide repeat protein, partial [Acidobacteriota bacterium]|nr:tetratricopeptide repeat protein [Acidobacteriota bacterium]
NRVLALGTAAEGRVQLELAILLLEGGDHEAALAALGKAKERMPENPEVHYRLGAAHRMAGNTEAAKVALRRFQELRARADHSGAESKRLGTDLNAALELARENRLPEALAKLEEILVAAPENARMHASKAKVLFSMGRSEDALAAIVHARELDPARSEHHFLEGVFLLSLGRAAEAEPAVRRALAIDPDLDEAHVMLAGALAKLGKPKEAAMHFARALELGVDTPPLRLGYAAVLETLGRQAESEEQLRAYEALKARQARVAEPPTP